MLPMFDDIARISETDSLHTLVIVIQVPPRLGRGVLLLNVSETEARVKHLDGYISVSFFINETRDTIVEYVQWRTAAHLAAAFRRPEFNEHLAVLKHIAHAEVGFYSVEHVLAPGTLIEFGPSFSGTVDVQVVKLPSQEMDAILPHMLSWADKMEKNLDSLRSVVIHADRANSKVALLMHHDGASSDSVWFSGPLAIEIDRAHRMTRYTTVSAPHGKGSGMRYVLSLSRAWN
jgi:hypothetical protein